MLYNDSNDHVLVIVLLVTSLCNFSLHRPLGRYSIKVAMSLCLSVSVSVCMLPPLEGSNQMPIIQLKTTEAMYLIMVYILILGCSSILQYILFLLLYNFLHPAHIYQSYYDNLKRYHLKYLWISRAPHCFQFL